MAAEDEWLSAKQIADLKLPGLPTSKWRVTARAQADNWQPFRPRQDRGGGIEYHLTALPMEARLEFARRGAGSIPTVPGPVATPATAHRAEPREAPLTTAGKSRLDAKLGVANAFLTFERLAASGGRSTARTRLIDKFTGFYNAGEIQVEPYVRQEKPRVSPASVARWVKEVETGNAAALAGRYGNRAGTGVFDLARRDLKGFTVFLMLDRPNWSSHHIHRALVERFGGTVELFDGSLKPLPSLRHLQRFMDEWKTRNKQLHLALTNPDAWKSRHKVAVGSYSEHIDHPNQLWELDASPSDVMATDGRRSLYVCVDVFTRRMMILVTAVPRASAVLLLLRRCILAWGMPDAVKTDNGSDFTAAEVERALALLKIPHLTCEPYSPEQKPHVERGIGTIQHSLMPVLPGYTGHDVAARQAIRSRHTMAKRRGLSEAELIGVALDGAQLQQLADAWVEHGYHLTEHDGLGGRTPAEVAAAWAGRETRIADERQLDLLLMPAGGLRTVGKKGIQVEGADFWAPELIPFVGTGERFEVRLDPEDMGRVWVFRPDPFAFVAIARNPEREGLSRRELAAEAAALQRRWLAEGKRQLAAARGKIRPQDVAAALIGQRPAITPPTVTALPTAALPLPAPAASPGIAAATAALAAAAPTAPTPLTPAQAARRQQIDRQLAAPPPAPEKPEDRWWRRAQAIEAAIIDGSTPPDDDIDWLHSIQNAPWYRARKAHAERIARAVNNG